MYLQIKELVLWPKNHSFKPRRLPFKTGMVNVISGASRTGKSAIIPIIDYCLGSEKCTIPVKTIRDACEWFGIIVETTEGEKLFARKEPGLQVSTGDMFILEGAKIEIPDQIDPSNRKATTKSVKHMLDELAGLTNLDFDVDEAYGAFVNRPSFRDFSSFTFQPQNVIANPDVLFYKADTYEHREKLRTIFPFVLNAVSPQLLALQHELAQLRKELKRKQAEFSAVKQVSDRWLAEIRSRVIEARELGLINKTLSLNLSKSEMVKLLEGVVSSTNEESRVSEETISDALEELSGLEKEDSDVSISLSNLRQRFNEMTQLKKNIISYKGALQIQRDRLEIASWIKENYVEERGECPVCGNNLSEETTRLNQFLDSYQELVKTTGDIDQIPASFDREYERVRIEIRVLTERLASIRTRMAALQGASEDVKKRRYEQLKIERFIGNIEHSLEVYRSIGIDSELEAEVQLLRNRISELEKVVNKAQIDKDKDRAIEIINNNAQMLLPLLDVEEPNSPISLLINDLTIKVSTTERADYLWEIGSGSNWLSYHLAIALGLQQFFMSLRSSPVPNFLIIDQPSQVYFPKHIISTDNSKEEDPSFRDEDVLAVRKVFEVLSKVVESSKKQFQVIVLDHAPDITWKGIPMINLVEEWRGGHKLVPMEWLTG